MQRAGLGGLWGWGSRRPLPGGRSCNWGVWTGLPGLVVGIAIPMCRTGWGSSGTYGVWGSRAGNAQWPSRDPSSVGRKAGLSQALVLTLGVLCPPPSPPLNTCPRMCLLVPAGPWLTPSAPAGLALASPGAREAHLALLHANPSSHQRRCPQDTGTHRLGLGVLPLKPRGAPVCRALDLPSPRQLPARWNQGLSVSR